jgi:dienelactone hydrolase
MPVPPGIAPSLNGNQTGIRIMKPLGEGPFPVLIGIAGVDGMYAFNKLELPIHLREQGIVMVDFAPQGRGGSGGQDNFNGKVHQDDLKAIVDFVSQRSFVQQDNIGVPSFSYGVVFATGALSRYPEMPVAFLIDWEGPPCSGNDFKRGIENNESWAINTIALFSGRGEMSPDE